MTASYSLVQWNRHKKVYDGVMGVACASYLGGFLALAATAGEPADPMVSLIRATGTLAIVLLHLILLIGPLSRFTTRLAPVLYNRRHAGVLLFFIALAHAGLVTMYYGSWGAIGPIQAMFGYERGVPFELFGFVALTVLFLMAATSHDFWLANLGHGVWKALHMMVYVAYGSVVLHVATGVLQDQRDSAYAVLLGVGVLTIAIAHIAAGLKERTREKAFARTDGAWIDACGLDELEINRARVVCVEGRERIAVTRHAGGVSAVSNVCAHQGGPLGEGEVIDGCLTCPWHGYQYKPEDGRSPPPYTEKIPTYSVRILSGRVQVSSEPHAPGTPVTPATVEGSRNDG